jgi:hypothetical protein
VWAALLVIMVSVVSLTAAGPAQAGQRLAVLEPLPPVPKYSHQVQPGSYAIVGATQTTQADGATVNLTIGQPFVSGGGASHSLASFAVTSADGRQNVQVGWSVDRLLNGDDEPHLFVIHRVDNVDFCYNDCWFEPYGPSTVRPGDPLPDGTTQRFGIQHFGGRWWILYNSEWIGSYPDSRWSGGFTQSAELRYFGEVAGIGDPSCSEMGTGQRASSTAAARFGSITVLNGPTTGLVLDPPDRYYDSVALSDRTFRYGGPGDSNC